LKFAAVNTNAADAHSGSNSIELSSDAGSLPRIQQYLTVPTQCDDGSVPSLSFWYRTQGVDTFPAAAFHIFQGFEDKNPPRRAEVHRDLPASPDYTQVTADLSVFAGYNVAINLEFLAASPESTFNADDFSIC